MRSVGTVLILFLLGCGSAEPARTTAISPAPPSAPTADAPPSKALLAFGQGRIFVSSIQPSEDKQLVAEVKLLTEPGQFKPGFLSEPNPYGFHTLRTETMDMARMGDPGYNFSAVLFAGNFADDKNQELGALTVQIVRPIRHELPLDAPSPAYRGLIFGNGSTGEYYLAHIPSQSAPFLQISLIGKGGPGPSEDWAAGLEVLATKTPDEPLARYAEHEFTIAGKKAVLTTRSVLSSEPAKPSPPTVPQ